MTFPGVTVRNAPGGVEKAVRSELRRLGSSVQSDGLAALAVSLAKQIDVSRGAVAAAAAAAQLRLILADVAKTAQPGTDAIDDVNDQPAKLRVVEG